MLYLIQYQGRSNRHFYTVERAVDLSTAESRATLRVAAHGGSARVLFNGEVVFAS